ncbi:hypothetical protein BGX33_002991 [Mortierella sp. NVP41]|nr:hypothetical protein BGX33_002991 [Mortierella sp. NVP41]
MAFEAPSPSSSSSSSAAASVKNIERLKRARHQSNEALEAVIDESAQLEPTRTMAWQNTETKDQSGQHNRQDSTTLNDTKKGSIQIPTPSHTAQQHEEYHDRTVVLQVRQPPRIHPFDSESSAGANMAGKPQDDRHHPLADPVRTPLPAARTSVEPSIHPLDSEARKDTKVKRGHPSEGRHQESSGHVQANPESTSHRTPTAPQHLDAVQQRPSTGTNMPPKGAASTTSTARTQQQPSSHQSSRSSSSNTAMPAAKPNPATLMLPITRDTLRELDLFEIFKNPQLRHDIVFDPHLQFRPNFDGERGLTKRREADRFWHEVGSELNARRAVLTARRDATTKMLSLAGLSASSPSSRMIQQQAQQMCPLPKAVLLPRLIDELREILLSLLPAVPNNQDGSKPPQQDAAHQENSERALLTSTLDPDLLLQELDHGVLDVHGLFRYLGDSLKGHCAPMRDTLVESMVHTVVNQEEIVRGIRMCFEILEWMKLDIANHQLRTLRPWLLDNSIDFEQKYFTEHLGRGGSLQRTTVWFKKSWIQWESVKQSVLGKPNASASSSSRRPNLAPSPSMEQDGNPQGPSPTNNLSPALSAANFKRRTSNVSTDIGENILDGVVNEGLLEMVLRPHGSVNAMPETFELDHYRLLLFHNDFQDLTILCILLILFRQLAQNCWTQQDLVEIKKVVWLLLTDENANFGANTNTGKAGSAQQGSSTNGGSSGMKDIVIQIEFAARRVRERSMNAMTATAAATAAAAAAESRRSSLTPETPIPTMVGLRRGSLASSVQTVSMATGSSLLHHPMKNPTAIPRPLSAAPSASTATTTVTSPAVPSLSASDTNLLTAWLDNALCRTSTLYKLIQKRLLIHFRRWLYLHSRSSMLVLSASCASLASAISMSSSQGQDDGEDQNKGDEDEDESTAMTAPDGHSAGTPGQSSTPADNGANTTQAKKTQDGGEGGVPITPVPAGVAPVLSAEEANKAAAEALAAKLSFNTAEMEAHGLTGLEDEMSALLEKIRAVSEFNKKVYGSWYRDLVKQGRAERWLDTASEEGAESAKSSSKSAEAAAATMSNSSKTSTKTMA